jgi:hypothetical protein
MVALAEAEEVEAVDREQPQPSGQGRQFVEIEQERDDAVAQAVPCRLVTPTPGA